MLSILKNRKCMFVSGIRKHNFCSVLQYLVSVICMTNFCISVWFSAHVRK